MNTFSPHEKESEMKISEVEQATLKHQQAMMRQITTCRMKIAEQEKKIADLQEKLVNVTSTTATWWDGLEPTNFEVFNSEHVIPMPTVVGEHIRFGANGMTSSYDPEEA